MENTINLVIDLKNMPPRYPFMLTNREQYSSDLSYRSHMNYFKSKYGSADTLLEDLAGGAVRSGFDAIRQTFFKTTNDMLEHEITSIVKEWAKNNPNAEWKD